MNDLIELLRDATALGTLIYGALAFGAILLLIFDRPPAVPGTVEVESTDDRRAA